MIGLIQGAGWLLGALVASGGHADAPSYASVFDGADPSALVEGDRIFLYPTGGGGSLDAWSSNDLDHWRKAGRLIGQKDIAWIDDDGARQHSLWAPHMLATNGAYYLYYSVGPQNPTPSRIGVAICKSPAGPCSDSGRPLLTGGNGFEAIDPMVFIDPRSRTPHLYAGGSAGATLRIYTLQPNLTALGERVEAATPPHFTEGAFMHERDGVYYLSYSSGRYNDASYSVHYSTAPSPTGPWTYRGVILKSDARFKGPGHHAFFRNPADGQWWIAYHRWEGQSGAGPYRGSRKVVVQPIGYDRSGAILPIRME